ncbi:MAG: hypothetical protein ABIH03_05945, partial [Pseudomonadota bacterium]
MPDPRPGESEDDFVGRCIPETIRDGTTDDPAQATAICHSKWREANSEERPKMESKRDHKWLMSAFLYGAAPERVDADAGVIHGAAIVRAGEANG